MAREEEFTDDDISSSGKLKAREEHRHKNFDDNINNHGTGDET